MKPSVVGRLATQLTFMLFLVSSGARTAAGTGWKYLSPVPGSSLNSSATTIILRPGPFVDRASLGRENPLKVSGSASGLHAGKLFLSDDSRTMIFRPFTPFAPGESVTITCGPGLRAASGSTIDPISFQFHISGGRVRPADIQQYLDPEGRIGHHFDPGPTLRKSPMFQRSAGIDSLPSGFPSLSVATSQEPTPGYIYLSNFPFQTTIPNTPFLMTVDTSGQPEFIREQNNVCLDFKLQATGFVTYFDRSFGYYLALDSTGAVVDSFTCGNGYYTDEHDLLLLPNGHALLLGDDFETVRMDTIVAGGDSNATVEGIIIQELDKDKNVVFEWRSWDHFEITDATHEDLTAKFIDYVHSNAIDVDTDGNLLLSSRHLDEITKIDSQTGNIIWRWGGKHNEFTFLNDTVGFSHQHAIRRIRNGNVTLFDNGNFHTPEFSRAVEYRLDEQLKTATLVWQYRNSPDIYGSAMGYVQRLDDGNTLIGWGSTNPSVTEVRPDGSKAFELTLPDGVFSYRAYKFITPLFTTGMNRVAGGLPSGYRLEQNYPNPFNPQTTIAFSLPVRSHVVLSLYSVLGQRISTLLDGEFLPGQHRVNWNAAAFSSGTYFYRLQAQASATNTSTTQPALSSGADVTRKMLLVR